MIKLSTEPLHMIKNIKQQISREYAVYKQVTYCNTQSTETVYHAENQISIVLIKNIHS